MKSLFTLFTLLTMTLSAMAQSFEPMNFAGPSTFGVAAMNAWQDNERDTIQFQMISTTEGNITLPALTYNAMGLTIPSFTIHNAQFDFDFTTFSATFPEQTYAETVMAGDVEKAITGYSLTAQYTREDNSFTLETVLSYGSMPVQVTYKINATYVADASSLDAIRDAAIRQAQIYDLTGRRVHQLKSGRIYIIDGKKTIIR